MKFIMLAAALVASLALLSQNPSTAAGTGAQCTGKHVYPNEDLALAAENARPGTTFCIHDGFYPTTSSVKVQDSDKFVGLYEDRGRPTVRGRGVENIFDASGADNATISGLRITGAVGGNYCEPDCGRGIRRGANLTVIDVRLDHNANSGIGGTGPGLLVKDSRVDHNGSPSFARDGGPVSAAGIKSTEPMTILNSHIHNNYWNGVWCDIDCGAFEIRNSRIENNGKAGVHYEISSGQAVVGGNIIRNNGVLPQANQHTGLLIVSSANVEAFGNRFRGNVGEAVKIIQDRRGPQVANVSLRDNVLINGDKIDSCTKNGVTCSGNRNWSR